MFQDGKILIGKSENREVYLYPKMANRHGMIAGATGTGKTVTLKGLAESFSDCGVPVFLADVKGDLAGMCRPGQSREDGKAAAYPTTFWDVYGENGIPLRTTISEMGPLLLSRIMDLNETQTDVLTVVFRIADDEQLLLIDTKDLKAMLQYVGEHSSEYASEYGSLPKQSLNAIVRAVVALEAEGGELFFGEPALDIHDWLRTDPGGRGVIQILDCQKLVQNPTMYAAFLLWMMSELFETLPETGDCDRPKLIFFFDEAHLLFQHTSKALLEKVEQVVKLIRSRGVGIYFITQSPKDIPDGVLAQLGNKIQHALHAYTPKEQKAVKAAAMSFRENPAFDTFETLQQLGIGEALVSVLDEEGVPTIVERCQVRMPQSQMGPLDAAERAREIRENLLYSRYANMEDRDSAYELLKRKAVSKEADSGTDSRASSRENSRTDSREKQVKSTIGRAASSAAGTIGREIGNEVGKQFGGSFGRRLGGNVGASLGRGILSTLFKWK